MSLTVCDRWGEQPHLRAKLLCHRRKHQSEKVCTKKKKSFFSTVWDCFPICIYLCFSPEGMVFVWELFPCNLFMLRFFHCSHGWCHGFTPVNALIDCWSSRLMVTALAVEQLLSCSDIPCYCLKMIKPEWSWEKALFWATSVWVPWNQELSAG